MTTDQAVHTQDNTLTLSLTTGNVSFFFSPTGLYLAVKRRCSRYFVS